MVNKNLNDSLDLKKKNNKIIVLFSTLSCIFTNSPTNYIQLTFKQVNVLLISNVQYDKNIFKRYQMFC